MSSAVDEDTVRAINTGRETIGDLLSSAQTHLQKIFIVFVIGFLGSFYALRLYIWDFLEATAKAQMDTDLAGTTEIITRTPFEVILLQAKIGVIVGIIISIPAVIYYAREPLKERGFESAVPISKLHIAGFVFTSLSLFCVGIVYAYGVFFPYAFEFLASNADSAGVKPSFGITEFTEFMALLTISFGLAAQLPLFMGALSYSEIVPYETFRDKWRHAIVAITVFGAFFSPPDPFTLIMWAIPLVVLYVFSLGLAKMLANMRRKGAAEAVAGTNLVKQRALQFGGAVGIVWLATAAFLWLDGFEFLEDELYPVLPESLQPGGPTALETMAAEYGAFGEVIAGLLVALAVGFLVLLVYTVKVLQSPVHPRIDQIRTGDPEEIDLDILDADAIEAVPPQAFLAMEEEEALEHARQAMFDNDRDKAQAILDRYDTLHADDGDGEGDAAGATAAATAEAGGGDGGEAGEESGGAFSSTAAGILDSFTEEETTEEDIGGYAYDLAFIFQSLTSKMFRIVGVFMLVMGGTFMWLYSGGLGWVLEQFVENVPRELLIQLAELNDTDVSADPDLQELIQAGDFVIALHPVEVLIFEVKVSLLAAIVAILPMVLYYSWPAMKERGLVRGDRRLFIVWGGSLLAGFAFGTYLGFFWIAPAVISYLIADAINAGMIISYRIKHFFWMVIFTTIGIGFLMNIIVTMALFHVGGIVSYRTMLKGWRVVVIAVFTFAALASPSGILTMLVLAFPIAFTYLLGLAILYVFTAGGRLGGGSGGGGDPVPEPETDAVAE
ncbi:twin-arginine translocase subunit TatC [Natronoglomus mannanivorans]|uniref:Sec-independent protein translocase protein TatC n=1 Tax=Natronoglomus mannanivorans TaxID=2979990 RepID=A0AAP2Z2D5_9EURY|nr:twin-arginine translocase subunit TatC [Halobacteria archaeon AArc-xg1-1]